MMVLFHFWSEFCHDASLFSLSLSLWCTESYHMVRWVQWTLDCPPGAKDDHDGGGGWKDPDEIHKFAEYQSH